MRANCLKLSSVPLLSVSSKGDVRLKDIVSPSPRMPLPVVSCTSDMHVLLSLSDRPSALFTGMYVDARVDELERAPYLISYILNQRTQRTGVPCLSMMIDLKGRCVRSVWREMVLRIPVSVSAILSSAGPERGSLSHKIP